MSMASIVLASAVVLAAPAVLPETTRDATVVYVFPTSPQTFVPIAGLPSFLAMPGAELPAVATQVVYSATTPLLPAPSKVITEGDIAQPTVLICGDFIGTVRVTKPDRFHLDGDGDGIGCEPEDR